MILHLAILAELVTEDRQTHDHSIFRTTLYTSLHRMFGHKKVIRNGAIHLLIVGYSNDVSLAPYEILPLLILQHTPLPATGDVLQLKYDI